MDLFNFYNNYFRLEKITTNDLILIITLVVLILYTISTLGVWRESVRQTFLQNTPIPAIYLTTENGKDSLIIKNIGSKPMINTKIENWNINFYFSKMTERYSFRFFIPMPNIIASNEEVNIIVKEFHNKAEVKNIEISPWINPKYSFFKTPVHVIFRDISGDRYYTKFLFGKGRFRMICPIKKYKILKFLSIKISNSLYYIKEPLIRYRISKKEAQNDNQ